MKEQFAWRHFYWYLTNEGIQYLRDYLHLPPEIVPATLRRSRPETGRPRPKGQLGWAQGGWAARVGMGMVGSQDSARSVGIWYKIVNRAKECVWGLWLLYWCPLRRVGRAGTHREML